MHLMIFSPGKVSHGFVDDDATDETIFNVVNTVITVEEGNGDGKVKKILGSSELDERSC